MLGARMDEYFMVEYYKGGPVPTEKSDVYQLGLLFAKMFSGINPQKRMKTGDFAEPVELSGFFIEGGLGKPLKDLIEPMLLSDPAERPTAAELVLPWQSLFLEAAKRSHALDGRVF